MLAASHGGWFKKDLRLAPEGLSLFYLSFHQLALPLSRNLFRPLPNPLFFILPPLNSLAQK
ncbi:MAG TPA: hypothetical protein V6D19_06885 [Stenomitos sp.]